MKTFGKLSAIFCISTLVACNNTTVEGSWIEPVPGMANMTQGFTLNADGTAASINMATLKYESWKQEGNLLILNATSIGNHQSTPFADTLTIEKLTADSLMLRKGELLLRYSKQSKSTGKEEIPASAITPAKKLISVKGELVIGHEVRSFRAEGSSADYWVDDETGELIQKYDETTKGTKNGKPVYVELEVADMGKAEDGFAADYDGVYQVMKINKIAAK